MPQSPVINKPLPRTTLEPVCEALAAVIRERRVRRGWSMNQLAALTRLSHPMIRFIETTARIPTVDTLARVSRAFGVPGSRLLAEAEARLKL